MLPAGAPRSSLSPNRPSRGSNSDGSLRSCSTCQPPLNRHRPPPDHAASGACNPSSSAPDVNESIPPSPQRRWLRWLKRLGWFALWLVTLLALLVVVENWRGRRAWEQFV